MAQSTPSVGVPRVPRSFYLKLGGACFVLGACMETFMFYTGFWDVALRKEAERHVEREQRKALQPRSQ